MVLCVVIINRLADSNNPEGYFAVFQNVDEQQKAVIHVATNSDKDV